MAGRWLGLCSADTRQPVLPMHAVRSRPTLHPVLLAAALLLNVLPAIAADRITGQGLKRIEEFHQEWKEIMSIYRFVTKEAEK